MSAHLYIFGRRNIIFLLSKGDHAYSNPLKMTRLLEFTIQNNNNNLFHLNL